MTSKIRFGLPSKGRLAQQTLDFLQACDLKVSQNNPRAFTGQISTIPQIEIWFQRGADIVRQVRDGVMDLAIAGYDTLAEYQGTGASIAMVHDALGFDHWSLEVIIPQGWADVNQMDDLVAMAQARPANSPLRVVSSYRHLTTQFLQEHSIPHQYLHADGGVEAAPQIGTADFIVDIVQTGLTLRENHLKKIDGGQILQNQPCCFGNRAALKQNPEMLAVARQLLERFEAHLRAEQHYNLIANIRGDSAEAVAWKLHQHSELGGLQGPTISPVYPKEPGADSWYAISLMVKKRQIQSAIQQLRQIGGSGVVVLPAIFIFDETPKRWQTLQEILEL